MSDHERSQADEAARRDYAAMRQTLEADTVSASIAAAWREGGDRAREHLRRLAERLRQLDVATKDELAAARDRAAQEQLSELDEPDVRRLIEEQVERLQEGAERLGLQGLKVVTSSSLPNGRVNAMCANDPGDGTTHVFADGELLVFCNSLGKLVASAFTAEKAQRPLPGLPQRRDLFGAATEPELLRRVLDLFVAVIFTGRARASEPWLPQSELSIVVAAVLAWGIEGFVVGHELAHAAAGHLHTDSLAVSPEAPDPGDEALAQEQEFEADGLAFELLFASTRGSEFMMFQLLAPFIFLKGVELLEAGQAVFEVGKSNFQSHPATLARCERMELACLVVMPDLETKLEANKAIARISSVFAIWRVELVAMLEKARAEGYAPDDARTPYRRAEDRPSVLG